MFGLSIFTKKMKSPPRTAVVGQWGEQLAVAFLKADGFSILGCNVRQNRHDEIDIIAQKKIPVSKVEELFSQLFG